MDYLKHYNLLIDRAQNRNISGYSEIHHIIPKCMGGSNDIINLVKLTAREHFIAHQLLIKIYPDNPLLVFAAKQMTRCSNGQRINNRLYEWLKKKHAKAVSEFFKGKKKPAGHSVGIKNPMFGNGHRVSGEKNGMYGKPSAMLGKHHSEETKQKMRKPKSEQHKEKHRGQNNPNYGNLRNYQHSDEVKEKISLGGKGLKRPKTKEHVENWRQAMSGFKHADRQCPHCSKVGAGPNMTRYHFKNCRALKISSTDSTIE